MTGFFLWSWAGWPWWAIALWYVLSVAVAVVVVNWLSNRR